MDPTPIPDDVLAAYAAGELAPAEAEAVRARAASDGALAARLAAAERLERALRADDLLPVPLSLLASVIERVRAEYAVGESASRAGAPASVRRTSPSVRGWGAVAAALVVALGLWAAASGISPAAALRISDAPVASALSERLGGGGSPPRAPSFDVADAWAELTPTGATSPSSSILWLAGGVALLTVAGVLARRFRPLFEAAATSPHTA